MIQRIRSWSKKLLAPLGYGLFRALHATLRIEHVDDFQKARARDHSSSGSYVLASLHENLLLAMMSQRNNPCFGLASASDAGRIGAFVAQRYGTPSVLARPRAADGRDQGGRAALDAMLEAAGRGVPLAITVDGPVGPRRVVKPGLVRLGSVGQVALLPFAAVASRSWRLRTWDRMRIPKPFSRVIVLYGEPVLVPAELSAEEFRGHQEAFGERLMEVDRRASEQVRRRPPTGLRRRPPRSLPHQPAPSLSTVRTDPSSPNPGHGLP